MAGMEKQITAGLATLAEMPSGELLLGHKAQPSVSVAISAARLERWVVRILRDEAFGAPQLPAQPAKVEA
jgi:hypothetical protein